MNTSYRWFYLTVLLAGAPTADVLGAEQPRITPLSLRADDVLATGNEWLALPDIRAKDGALTTFNVLSMHARGLLQASGEAGRPVLEPYFKAADKAVPLQ